MVVGVDVSVDEVVMTFSGFGSWAVCKALSVRVVDMDEPSSVNTSEGVRIRKTINNVIEIIEKFFRALMA